MKILANIIDLTLHRVINYVDNHFKYTKSKSKEYYLSDQLLKSDPNFIYWKNKLLYTLFLSRSISDNPKEILEIGCGTGRFLKIYPSDNNITGIDINKNMISYAKKSSIDISNLKIFNMDIKSFHDNFPNKKFDLIYSIGVYGEHAFLDKESIEIISSHTKENGFIFLTLYEGGLRRMGLAKVILVFISKLFKTLNFVRTSLFLSKGIDLESLLENNLNLKLIEKSKKITKSKLWNGSHLLIILQNLN